MSGGPESRVPADLLQRLYARTRGGAPRDPRRTRRLLDRLGIPDPSHVVHVVGTTGKGSTAWRIDAGLRAAGMRSLRFLSPHVESFDERIAVDGVPVTSDEVASFLERAWRDEPEPRAAFFELCTAMALDVAARRGAPWAVLEAGVGASRDATLAVRNVRAVVLTNVSMDHAEAIGPTLHDIARDKAEAIRPGVPVITAARGEALAIVREVASERGAPLWVRSDRPDVPAASPTGESLALARAALDVLDLGPARRAAASAAAARTPELPARRERFEQGGRSVLLDGAHNAAATRALAEDLPPGYHLLLGVLQRKDPQATAAPLLARAERVTLTAAEPGERPFARDARFEPDAERALGHALDALPQGGLLVIAGSFYLAGRLRPLLRDGILSPAAPGDASSARTPPRP